MQSLIRGISVSLGAMVVAAAIVPLSFPLQAQQEPRLSLAERVDRLEQQMQAQKQKQSQGGVDTFNQIQQLQSQLQQLHGQIEVLQHQLQQGEEGAKAQYLDLDSRLTKMESRSVDSKPMNGTDGTVSKVVAELPEAQPTPAASVADAASPAKTPSARSDEQAAYEAAYGALKGGDSVAASRAFRDFIKQYPNSSLQPNAWYWLGESFYSTTNYPLARDAFQYVLSTYPQSEKAPDAMLKLGYSHYQLKDIGAARITLQSLLKKYPDSRAAALAKERLKQLTTG